MLLALLLLIRRFDCSAALPRYWISRGCGQGLSGIARLGLPVAVMLALEYWAFAISSMWAGWLGPTSSRRTRSRSTWLRSPIWCRSASVSAPRPASAT